MQLDSPAIILSAKAHGESSAVVGAFTLEHGRVRGLVKGGRKQRAALQVGNIGQLTLSRRLETQLGTLKFELLQQPSAKILDKPMALNSLLYMAEVLEVALPEEQPYSSFYNLTQQFLLEIQTPGLLHRLAFWELHLLMTLGYGLSLDKTTAVPCESGTPLTYVSPNTGRAVSEVMGAPYRERLLPLPNLFGGPVEEDIQDLRNAFRLTGHFLEQAVHGKRLTSREQLMGQV